MAEITLLPKGFVKGEKSEINRQWLSLKVFLKFQADVCSSQVSLRKPKIAP